MRNHFDGAEEGSIFADLAGLGKALDRQDRLEGKEYPPCGCGASAANGWQHPACCLWFNSQNDPPYNNALKIRLQDKFWEDSTGENMMPVEPMEEQRNG